MARMGSYCRAYHARDFLAFAGWSPDPSRLRPDPDEGGEPRNALRPDDVVYLQQDYGVTDGIFMDEHVLFADAGPGWRAFCTGALGFDPAAGEYGGEPEETAAEPGPAAP